MSVEAIVLQSGEGKTVSLGGTQVAYKAVGPPPGRWTDGAGVNGTPAL